MNNKKGLEKTMENYINKVICGDCLEVMKDMPDKSVDLILTDPPYGIGVQHKNCVAKRYYFLGQEYTL